MAFIGESKEGKDHPWRIYVCLNLEDCELIIDAVSKSMDRIEKSYDHYKDILEGGEATLKQEDKYIEAEMKYETISNVHTTICEFVRRYKTKK